MSVAKVKKGNTVIMCGFTGMKLGVYKVTAADKDTITIEKADGTEVDFVRKTGKQVDPKNPKYANSIIEDDGSYVNPRDIKKPAKKKPATKKAKKEEVEEEELEEEDEDEEEEEEVPAPKKKAASKKKETPKKKAKKVEEDEDDDYEEVE